MRLLSILFLLCGLASRAISAPSTADPMAAVAYCDLPAPLNLQITGLTPNSVTAVWQDVAGAVGYQVTVIKVSTSQTIFTGQIYSTFITVGNLLSQTSYELKVQAIAPGGCISPNTASAAFTTPFIIIDEIIVEFPNPVPITPSTNIPWQWGTPIRLAFDDGLDYVVFEYAVGKPGQPNTLRHENPSCSHPGKPACYSSGWHFAGVAPPPLVPYSTSQNAMEIQCFHLTEDTDVSDFPMTQELTFVVALNGDHINVEQTSGETQHNFFWNRKSKNRSSDGVSGETEVAGISPNPFDDILSVNLAPGRHGPTTLQLTDASGRTLRLQEVGEKEPTAYFGTADLAPGVYFVNCESEQATEAHKVVKLRN